HRRAAGGDRPQHESAARRRRRDRVGVSRPQHRTAAVALQPCGPFRGAGAGRGPSPDHSRRGGQVMAIRNPQSAIRILVAGVACLLSACSPAPRPDAYGNVEATEVIVSAETAGRIASLSANEGDTLKADAVVGSIDAAELTLARDQLAAQRAATASRV